jgi:mxaJ protein
MFSRCLISAAILTAISVTCLADARPFRVCVEPDNLPFSDAEGNGFENKIAAVVAEDLGRPLVLVPIAQRGPGFFRQTLGAGRCDALLAMPEGMDDLLVTAPYYESGWVFVSRADRHLEIAGFDDPKLNALKIGIPVVGDGSDTPPVMALGERGLTAGLHRYPISGDPGEPPADRMIRDLMAGRIDLAVMWGPAAGYFVAREGKALAVTMTPRVDRGIAFRTAIGMAVTERNTVLRDALESALQHRHREIDAILAAYHVPVER